MCEWEGQLERVARRVVYMCTSEEKRRQGKGKGKRDLRAGSGQGEWLLALFCSIYSMMKRGDWSFWLVYFTVIFDRVCEGLRGWYDGMKFCYEVQAGRVEG